MKIRLLILSLFFISFFSTSNVVSGEQELQPNWGMWVNSQYKHDDTNDLTVSDEFNMRSIRLIAKGKVTNALSYHVMGEFVGPDKKPHLMQAWMAYKAHKYAIVRVGQFKYPFGMDAYGPWTKWKFANMTYVTGGVVKNLGQEGALLRDIGIEIAGVFPLSGSINGVYKLMLMNGSGANKVESNNNKDVVGFWGFQFPHNVLLGCSVYQGVVGSEDSKLDEAAFGTVFQIMHKKYTVQAEYITASYQQTGDVDDLKPGGYYAYGTYMVHPKIEIGIRYDAYESDTNKDDTQKSRVTVSTGYYFSTLNRVLLNYEIRNDDKNSDLGNLLTVQFQTAL